MNRRKSEISEQYTMEYSVPSQSRDLGFQIARRGKDGRDLIHPESLHDFVNAKPNGKIFYCSGLCDGYLRLKYGEKSYSVKPILFKETPEPLFHIEQKVMTQKDNTIYIVRDINWHFNQSTHIYYLTLNGKRKSKRYFAVDLRPIVS